MKRIELTLFLIVISILLMGAKNSYNSFDRLDSYDIGFVVQDTTTLGNHTILHTLLVNIGFRVIKIDTAALDDSTYDGGTTTWSSLDAVVLMDETFGSTIPDTSKLNGIGDVPIFIYEESFWNDFGLPDCTGVNGSIDDSIRVAGFTSLLTNIYSTNYDSLEYLDGTAENFKLMDGASLTASNLCFLSLDGTDTLAVIDTVNSRLRVACGFPKAIDYAININEELGSAFTPLLRFLANATGTISDSLFTFGVIDDNISDEQGDGIELGSYLESNGHKVYYSDDKYIDSTVYSTKTSDDWDNLDAVAIATGTSVSSKPSLITSTTSLPIYTEESDFARYAMTLSSNSFGVSSDDSIVVTNNSSKLTGNYYTSVPDSFDVFTTEGSMELISSLDGSAVSIAYILENSSRYSWAHKDSVRWVFLGFGFGTIQTLTDSAYAAIGRSFGWLFESFPTPPSNVTLTTLSTDSMSVTWSDNYGSEDNYAVMIIQPDSQYFSYPAADATIDTLFPFWPPNAEIIVDIGVVEGTDTVFSSTGPDTGYTLAAVPPDPRTDMLNDTTMLFSLDGYLFNDNFSDEDYTADPVWTVTAGTWQVDSVYRRLESAASTSAINVPYGYEVKDVNWYFSFHFNDSLALASATQQIFFYIMTKNGVAADSNYYVYVDDDQISLTFHTGATPTGVASGSFTGDYKWHDVRVKRDWTSSPFDTTIAWTLYLDGDSIAYGTDTRVFDDNVTKMGIYVEKTRNWFDEVFTFGVTPSQNHDSTHYAVQEQNSGNYVDWRANPDTLASTTEIWGTFNEWRSTGWDTLTGLNANTSYIIRAKARNGQQ